MKFHRFFSLDSFWNFPGVSPDISSKINLEVLPEISASIPEISSEILPHIFSEIPARTRSIFFSILTKVFPWSFYFKNFSKNLQRLLRKLFQGFFKLLLRFHQKHLLGFQQELFKIYLQDFFLFL